MRYLIGIDEAGRGPLAGPVAVGAVMVPSGFDVLKVFPGVKDSKLLSPQKRRDIYDELVARSEAEGVRYGVRFSGHASIDTFGITLAVRRSVAKCVRLLAPSQRGVHVYLDGLLHAPEEYEQETIVRGDILVPLISLASIVAKVRRDEMMERFALRYPAYGFEAHKGYATKRHRAAIRKFGLCRIHRATYCSNLLRTGNTV